jgi:hypothetical protein
MTTNGGQVRAQDADGLRAALAKIAELASAAANGASHGNGHGGSEGWGAGDQGGADTSACIVRALPTRLLVKAADTSRRINPANAPVLGPLASVASGFHVADPMRIAVLTSKYWGPTPRTLTVSFMESTPADLKSRIVSHMNAWAASCSISFALTNGTSEVRISREAGGYWSYLGTDILHIPKNRQTMNLAGFTMNTRESEYHRVVRHETGHTLGFPHEHMRAGLVARIDRQKAYEWFLVNQGWDQATVDAQVLTPLDESSLMGTPVDQTSIMCYQLPAAITTDGEPITGGTDINSTDYSFAGSLYPKQQAVLGRSGRERDSDWPASDDPEVRV